MAEADVDDVALVAQRYLTIRGRVLFAEASKAPGVVSIVAEPANGDPGLGLSVARTSRDDPTGTFELAGLKPGFYSLRVTPPDGWLLEAVSCGTPVCRGASVDISTQEIDSISIRLNDKQTQFIGLVRDQAGRPVVEVAIVLFPSEREQWRGYGFTPHRIRAVRVTEQGSAQISGMPAGRYLAAVVPLADIKAWQRPDYLDELSKRAVSVTIQWGNETRITFQKNTER